VQAGLEWMLNHRIEKPGLVRKGLQSRGAPLSADVLAGALLKIGKECDDPPS